MTRFTRTFIVLIVLLVLLAWCSARKSHSEPEFKVYQTEQAWSSPSPSASPAAAPVIKTPTKPAPRKTTRASRTRSERHGSASHVTNSSSVWALLADCESGGDPTANTGNGYYGMYQFTLGTWYSVGGEGRPNQASAEEQTRRAKILQARSGWGQWPACSRKLGLR
jgi:hypothetical protein